MNSQKHLKQFSNGLLKSLPEAEDNHYALKLDSLQTRRQQQTNKLFNQINNKSEHRLHYLLPTAVIDRLRSADKLSQIFTETNRFKNPFTCFCLNSLQCD